MINVSDETKAAFLSSSTQKTIYIEFPNKDITLTNEDIVSESFTLKQTLESEDELTFTGCNASQVKFQAAEIVEDLRGELMTVTIQAGDTEPIKLFTGYVDSQSNLTYEDFITEIVAYDAFYQISQIEVPNEIEYTFFTDPRTIKRQQRTYFTDLFWATLQNLDRFFKFTENQNDYYLKIAALALHGMSNDYAITASKITWLDLLKDLCAWNAAYGYIDGDGLFCFKELKAMAKGLYPSQNIYPSSEIYPTKENAEVNIDMNYIYAQYEPFETTKFDYVYMYNLNGQAYGRYPNPLMPNPENPYNIGGKIVGYAASVASGTECLRIYNIIHDLWYKPSMVKTVGRPWVEIGDTYIFKTRKNIIRSYVLKRTLIGIQALFDTYESEGKEKYESGVSDATKSIDTNSIYIGDNNGNGILSVNGHEVTFKTITISGTTYHLLGYTE